MKLLKVKSVDKVFKIIRENFRPINRFEKINLLKSKGRILGEDVNAHENSPPFFRSSVDGYAVVAQDTYGASETLPAFLEVKGEIKMGEGAGSILTDETKYIPTGGMLPEGANAVVMIEHTEKLGNQVMIYKQVAPGENVINIGDDVKKGELVLKKGTVVKEAEIGALAALGITEIKVYKKPVVGILSTGNELVSFKEKELINGQIRDINSLTLAGLAENFGAEVIQGGIVKDDFNEILEKARSLIDNVDILLFSGGSSVGTLDFTSRVIKSLGEEELLIEGISVKPGKPTLLGRKGNKVIWGLPGHPVSAMMIFQYFGKELIPLLGGKNESHIVKPSVKATLTRNVPSSAGRTDWIRVKLVQDSGRLLAEPVFGKSGLIKTLVESHGYIEIPEHKEGLEAGSWVEVILWN